MDLDTFNTLYKRERHPGVYKDFIDDLKIDTPTKFSTYPNGQAAYNAKKGLQNAARKLDIRTRILVLRNRPEWEVWAVRDGPRAK